ncbi:MAG TPA: AarF/ABC1/UbiB kinase family protein [Candidatus Polarisedimenticolaceae bacterium]|nr:AarF/ABC1/UbiB kinase family protein [Candidatus Polarisedimenticolaceae bacterium]
MSRDEPPASALRRLGRLGGLIGRVGVSVAASRLLELGQAEPARRTRRSENLVRNATRIVQTLGEMKGAAMKLGQMLSLHDGLLPPEVAQVLRSLQREAPKVPAEVMQYELRGALPAFDQLFESIEPEAFAAASIGQVHRGRLRDGRRVAVKIQYPLIDEIIKADLKNLRVVLQSLFRLFSDADFEPVWREVRERLLEELDYTIEADHAKRVAQLYAGDPQIVVPRVIDEATATRILTMERIEGITPAEACSERHDQPARDRWGLALFDFVLSGLLEHRFLHADPNLANFAFREDGRIIVYDFGCMKRVPVALARGYARLMRAAVDRRPDEIPAILHDIGVMREDGRPIERELIAPYFDLFAEIVRPAPPYAFGENERLYERLVELGISHWTEAADIRFPEDIVFIDRALSGHFGNLTRLGASGPWRERVLHHTAAIG